MSHHRGCCCDEDEQVQACCIQDFPGFHCEDLLPSACIRLGGAPMGPGTTCKRTDCELLGLCPPACEDCPRTYLVTLSNAVVSCPVSDVCPKGLECELSFSHTVQNSGGNCFWLGGELIEMGHCGDDVIEGFATLQCFNFQYHGWLVRLEFSTANQNCPLFGNLWYWRFVPVPLCPVFGPYPFLPALSGVATPDGDCQLFDSGLLELL